MGSTGPGLRSGSDEQSCRLRFVNGTSAAVEVLWVDYQGEEVNYRTLQPGGTHVQGTYMTHPWRVREEASRKLLVEYVGPAATVELLPGGTCKVHDGFRTDILPHGAAAAAPAEWGTYRKRAETLHIPVLAYDCVREGAVARAVHLLEHMLADTPWDIRQRLADMHAEVAIIGRKQVTTDIPPHSFLRGEHCSGEARTYDDGCRGLGGNEAVPTTSVGEENLTMVDDRWFPCENILLHEFGHTVMDLGLSQSQRQGVLDAYAAAMAQRLYNPDCYMAKNASEYWAEATQAWFDATVRTDVTDGINTREKLKGHDPALAALMAATYGDGTWCFPHTAPTAFAYRERICSPIMGAHKADSAAHGSTVKDGQRPGWLNAIAGCLPLGACFGGRQHSYAKSA